MGLLLPERLQWLEHALQGLPFWIGHRRSMFPHYLLPEGDLVAEACNLIQGNLPPGLMLMPERMYRNLVSRDVPIDGVAPQERADLVLCKSAAKAVDPDGNLARYTKFVIEVFLAGQKARRRKPQGMPFSFARRRCLQEVFRGRAGAKCLRQEESRCG
jgi:hypothetical protein